MLLFFERKTRMTSLNYKLITSEPDLIDACNQISNSEFVAVDTEFKRENTYFPIPCLIQLATHDLTVCIDPNHITNLTPLKDLLFSEKIIKIFHASRQDLEIFYFMFNQVVSPVFDTQISASILGYPDQIGYASLVKQVLDVELDKSQTRTDWSKRPFTSQQLAYAANDVIYLISLYKNQLAELSESVKKDWPQEDFKKLYNIELYRPEPESAWKKLKNYQHLPFEQKKVAYNLSMWRENEAIKRNKPRKFILSDAALLDIASKQPTSSHQLTSINDINKFMLQRYGEKLIELVNSAQRIQNSDCPQPEEYQLLSTEEKKLLKQIQNEINNIAKENKLSSSFIASRKELEKLIRGNRDLDVLKGWRGQLVGNEILQILQNPDYKN